MQEKYLSYTMLSEDRNPIWRSSTCHMNLNTTHHMSARKSLLKRTANTFVRADYDHAHILCEKHVHVRNTRQTRPDALITVRYSNMRDKACAIRRD